jgi:hypothetical protein
MSHYIFNDGEHIVADSETDLVQKMQAGSFQPEERSIDLPTFMQTQAKRFKKLMGIELDTTSPETFVHGLMESGILGKTETVRTGHGEQQD